MSHLTISKSDVTRVLDAMALPLEGVRKGGELTIDIPAGRHNEFFYVANQVLGEEIAWKLVLKRRQRTGEPALLYFPDVTLVDDAAA